MTMLDSSPTLADVKQLCAEAERCRWYAPHESLKVARATYHASLPFSSQLQTLCTLTLGAALNATGRFAEAATLLESMADPIQSYLQPMETIRYHAELVIAYAYLGRFDAAQAVLARVQESRLDQDNAAARAHYDRAAGILQREQTYYHEASSSLQRAAEAFANAGDEGESALTQYELTNTNRHLDPSQALEQIGRLRQVVVPGDAAIWYARCDYLQATVYDELNRYAESQFLYRRAWTAFDRADLNFSTALCDVGLGVAHYRLNQYDESLQAYHRARAALAGQQLDGYAALCDFDIAITLFALNRYLEALELYQRVADQSLVEGRLMRAARCYGSMALCYDRLGQYERALPLHERARAAFLEAGNILYAALYEENLAGTLRCLGRQVGALQHYRHARDTLSEQSLPIYLARCDTHLADLYLALKQYEDALACLTQARTIYDQQGMIVHIATCDREIARALIGADRIEAGNDVFALLSHARSALLEHGLLVDAALCDVATGEAHFHQGQLDQAEQAFLTALAIVDPAFPDEAWRVHNGLGQCALGHNDRAGALRHWLNAIERVHQIRSHLPTEQLSGGFFADHRQLYGEALQLALETATDEAALIIVEASKAQVHAGRNTLPAWQSVPSTDTYARALLEREAQLRCDIDALRRQLRVVQHDEGGPILRSVDELTADQSPALERLVQLSRDYEHIIEQLRLIHAQPLDNTSALFSVPRFRDIVNQHLAQRWACLAYHISNDALTIFFLDAQRLIVRRRHLTPYDRMAMRQCTESSADYRELIYRSTLRGQRVPTASGPAHLRHLYQLLIPPEVNELTEDDLLIVAPHGSLHALPFHALLTPDGALLTQVPLVYTPSLSAFQALLAIDRSASADEPRALVCGLSDYGSRARLLPHADQEMAALQEVWRDRLDTLWGQAATREAILRLNATRQLANYATLHFIAHAVIDPLAPSQSRVLLYDDDLTFADILNLRLRSRCVTLSACDSAIGQLQPGDEMMALARAFFHAGTRSVIASLWPVEDEASGELMRRLYQHLGAGKNVAQALRAAQLELAASGAPPYQWAAFIVIGLP